MYAVDRAVWEDQLEDLQAPQHPRDTSLRSWTVPRKGRLVQPRHIFPWIAAPYIEMLRILLRIERFFFLPIRYLQAWTVSAIFGVMGVLFSVALFIPRLAATSAHASTGGTRDLIRLRDMPYIPEEDLVLPESDNSGTIDLSVRMQRTHVEDFDQNERVTTYSKAWIPKRSLIAQRDVWTRHLLRPAEPEEQSFQAYVQQARVRSNPLAPVIPEMIRPTNSQPMLGASAMNM